MKTSHLQYKKLLEFMERYGDLSKPPPAPHGRQWVHEKWTELTALLNCEGQGEAKSEEKWRKVWSDWKNNCKKKNVKINNQTSDTGLVLSDQELRVMKLMGQTVGVPKLQQDDEQSTVTSMSDEYDPLESSTNPEVNIEIDDGPKPLRSADEKSWQPPSKKQRIQEDAADIFTQSHRIAREYDRERNKINDDLERERLRQRADELKLRELEVRERVRQRDVELQLQAQWLALMKQCVNVVTKYFKQSGDV